MFCENSAGSIGPNRIHPRPHPEKCFASLGSPHSSYFGVQDWLDQGKHKQAISGNGLRTILVWQRKKCQIRLISAPKGTQIIFISYPPQQPNAVCFVDVLIPFSIKMETENCASSPSRQAPFRLVL